MTSSNNGDLKIHVDANKEPDWLKKEPPQPWTTPTEAQKQI